MASDAITRLLQDLRDGHTEAEEAITALVYEQLRRIAGGMMRKEPPGHTLQPTAIVHEAFLKLRPQLADTANRRHLYAAAKKAMRQVLIDRARRHKVRREAVRDVSRMAAPQANRYDPWSPELIEALEEFARLSPRRHEVVEYRFLVGLTVEETAEQLELSRSQIESDWRLARAWLYARLRGT